MQVTGEPIAGSLEQFRLSGKGTEGYVPGGFWRRFVAMFVDGAIVGVLTFPVSIVIPMILIGAGGGSDPSQVHTMTGVITLLSWIIQLVVIFFYYGWFYANKGASPGKLLMGLRVVDEKTGTNLSYWRTFGRETIGKVVSYIVLGIGFLMVAFTKEKKALHDIMFGTRVIRKAD